MIGNATQMKFSLLIPTKNRPVMLRRAMKHILNQSYEDFEAIVVDDSADRNDEMAALSAGDSRIKYIWRHGKGIGSAMNVALRAATGDVFNWHNDDDFIAKRTLEYISKRLGDAAWCYGIILIMNGYRFPIGKMGRPFNFEVEKGHSTLPQPAVFWTRKAFDTVGYFQESMDEVTDHEYWMRLATNFEPRFFRRIFAYYFVHADMGSKKFASIKTEQFLALKEKYKNIVPVYLSKER